MSKEFESLEGALDKLPAEVSGASGAHHTHTHARAHALSVGVADARWFGSSVGGGLTAIVSHRRRAGEVKRILYGRPADALPIAERAGEVRFASVGVGGARDDDRGPAQCSWPSNTSSSSRRTASRARRSSS